MYYYILVDPDKNSKAKLGVTRNTTSRIRSYRTAAPQCFYYQIYEDIDKIHERKILDILRDVYKVDREFVHCDPHILENIIDGYFTDNSVDIRKKV